MYSPYNENFCKLCPFKGTVAKPVRIFDSTDMCYVDCQRDNEAAKEHFIHTLKDEEFLWLHQVSELGQCIYDYNAYGWTLDQTGLCKK